jgi:transcriptional regulator with XRE-family HTH domain
MADAKTPSFGGVIRKRRRELNLTQEELARRIKTSIPYIGHLEAEKRHPSEKVVVALANALKLDGRELFLLANPEAKAIISEQPKPSGRSAWNDFARDDKARKVHEISDEEMEILSRVAKMGEVMSKGDFIFILNTIRQALGR